MKHTPAPWKASVPETNSYYQYYVYAENEINGFDQPIITELLNDFCTDEQAQANAKLIAAAPLLLEVARYALADLESCIELLQWTRENCEKDSPADAAFQTLEDLRQAISAATE